MSFYLILAVLLSIPAGYGLAWLARDELVQGRKWFVVICLICSILAIFSFFVQQIAMGFSLISIGIVAYISYKKSFDKRFTKAKRNL